jgi:aminoglycoside 3-N-acetyltransferase
LPTFFRHLDGRRILADVRKIVETDRWNSFHLFPRTSQFVASRYQDGGLEAEVVPLQTGGVQGSGKWRIPEAWDVESATLRVVEPRKAARVLADYSKNPFHVVMWSAGTPKQWLRGPAVVVDSIEEAQKAPAGRLKGCFVLTKADPRGLRPWVVEKGAVGIVYDGEVKGMPHEVEWRKFGWGGWPSATGQMRCVGFCISSFEGAKLREQMRLGTVTLEAKARTRAYVGHHDVVSATLWGNAKPDDEVWALGHLFEPGAADNASGCAALIAAAKLLGRLVHAGEIEAPRRTVRFVNGFENYGHFTYYEEFSRLQPPIAGIDVDAVGVDPRFCDGKMFWSASVADSPNFPYLVGSAILRSALRLSNPGYRLHIRPFELAGDNLLGDPRYGMPTPWLTTYPYQGYHSSGDTPRLLSPQGLAVSTAAVAAFLYFLAQAGNPELFVLAKWESNLRLANIHRVAERQGDTPERALARTEREVALHDRSLRGLERLIWGGERLGILNRLETHRERIRRAADQAAGKIAAKPPRRGWQGAIERLVKVPASLRGRAGCVVLRKAKLAPALENLAGPAAKAIRQTGLPAFSEAFADNRRNVREIAGWAALEKDGEPDVRRALRHFDTLKTADHVQYADPRNALTQRKLEAELRKLGLRKEMDLMVHSSLSSFGPVIGGADAVIDALLSVIGPAGTLMMPSFNHGQAKVFDINTTPTNNGEIPDTFWRRPGVRRSLYPTHSLAAFGPKAERWTEGHLESLWMGPESPLGRLVHEGGYILLLGVDHRSNTSYHVAETSMNPSCLGEFMHPATILDTSGQVKQVKSMEFRCGRCPVTPNDLDRALTRQRLQTKRRIGRALCALVKGQDIFHAHRTLLGPHCPTCPIRPRPGG